VDTVVKIIVLPEVVFAEWRAAVSLRRLLHNGYAATHMA